MVRDKHVSALELVDAHIARIETENPRLNAVVAPDFDRARLRAQQADAALARGDVWGPLHGLPMTIKDSFETAGLVTTSGAPELRRHVPSRNAAAVQRLIDAGAIILGKTNLPLYAGDIQTFNSVYGRTNHHLDVTRSPGGSSGGAAVAVAAGMSPCELGSDIGGSIRCPAHFTGLYGHKPSHGIVPQRGHIPPAPGALADTDLNVVGPLARNPEDLSLLLDILSGPESGRAPGAAHAWKLSLPPARAETIQGLRIAFWWDEDFCPLSDDVQTLLEGFVDRLERAGAKSVTRAFPEIDPHTAYETYETLLGTIIGAGLPERTFSGLTFAAGMVRAAEQMGIKALYGERGRLAKSFTARHRAWLEANEIRAQIRARVGEFFKHYDVLVMPVAPTAAPKHKDKVPIDRRKLDLCAERKIPAIWQLRYIALASMAYLPATVAPIGTTPTGLPVGAQLIGPHLEDRTPLALASALINLGSV